MFFYYTLPNILCQNILRLKSDQLRLIALSICIKGLDCTTVVEENRFYETNGLRQTTVTFNYIILLSFLFSTFNIVKTFTFNIIKIFRGSTLYPGLPLGIVHRIDKYYPPSVYGTSLLISFIYSARVRTLYTYSE